MKLLKRLTLLLVIPMLIGKAVFPADLFNIKLSDLENNSRDLSDFSNRKAIVIVFLLADCPACEDYSLTLNKLSSKYNSKGITFIGVFPGKFATDSEMISFRDRYKINFLLLKDPDFILAKKLEARVVPGCFVIKSSGDVVYRGRIDDWLYALGKKRFRITQNNLSDAINSVVSNRNLKIRETTPIGCILEY